MPRCKNCPSLRKGEKPCYYTGNETTPRGKGYCAQYEKEGQRRRGKNGKMYKVKNGRWVSVSSSSRSKARSPRMINDEDYLDFDEFDFKGPNGSELYKNDDGHVIYKDGDLKIVLSKSKSGGFWEHMSEGNIDNVNLFKENLDSINRLENHLRTAEDFFDQEAGYEAGDYLVEVVQIIKGRLDNKQKFYNMGRRALEDYPDLYELNEHAEVRRK